MLYPPPITASEVANYDGLSGKDEQECFTVVVEPRSTFRIPVEFAHFSFPSAQYASVGVVPALSSLGALLREIDGVVVEQPNEHTPTDFAIERAKALISGAEMLIQLTPPVGELDSYYGELGIEWRSGNRILRLTCFGNPATPARLDYGTMSTGTPGEYQSDAVADSAILAARLDWLSA
jgi:hypothetical protein